MQFERHSTRRIEEDIFYRNVTAFLCSKINQLKYRMYSEIDQHNQKQIIMHCPTPIIPPIVIPIFFQVLYFLVTQIWVLLIFFLYPISFFFFKLWVYLFIYFWLCWVFVSVRGLSLGAASGGHSSLRCVGLSLLRPLLLWGTGSRCAGSVVVAHGPSCSAACGIFPDQGSNPCPLHWQADSQSLHHQGSPIPHFWILFIESFAKLKRFYL